MQNDLDFFSDRQMPFLSTHISLPQILAVEDHIPGHPNEIYEDEVSIQIDNPVSHKHLLSIPEFQNILIEREVLITDILYLGIREGFVIELENTLTLISAELEE